MTLNVMIVDDSAIMVQKLSAMLRELGHEVVRMCTSGKDAVRDYAIVKPDLVTMDITMPGMDGVEATRAIIAKSTKACIIMVTSHGQEAMVTRSIEAGALGYVLKPVTKERLSAMISKVVAHTRNRDDLGPRPSFR
jgi:two-component system chemotaxis response regulator CheY